MKRKPIGVDGVVVRLNSENILSPLKEHFVWFEVDQFRVTAVVKSC